MPRAPETDEIEILRYPGQSSSLRLAVFTPHVIYSARLASVPSSTDMVAEISFSDGVGTLANVKRDMTMYIGTTAGAYDLGMVRIRKSPISGTFYIEEESIIAWQADLYLTVVDDFDLRARHIRIDETTSKIDYDILYSDQHTVFVPVPVLGPIARAVKLVNGTASIQLGPETGSSSWVYGSTISSYSWSMAGATLNNSAVARPIATVTAPGWYLAYCTVTAANGKSRQGVRYIYVYDDDNPPMPFTLNSCDENVDSGGVSFSVTMTRQADFASVRKQALCILFSEDIYDATANGYIGSLGPIAGAENIEAIGRIIGESIRYDAEKGEVNFEIAGMQEWMKRLKTFPVGLELATQTPSVWTSMPALTPDRAIWHLCEYRSTITTIMDVTLTGDTRYAKELQSLSSNLWSQMDEFAGDTILANLGVDPYGRFFVEIEAQVTPEDERSFPEIMTLEKTDYTGAIELEHITTPEISLVDLSGVSIDISGGALAFFALSPGHVPNTYGEARVDDRLLLTDQDQANQLAGLIYGWMTNPYKPISINIRNNKFITCIPAQYVTITIDANDNPRGIDITIRMIPRRRRLEFNKQTGYKSYSIEFEAESFEGISVNGDIPGSDDTSIPPLPALPEIPIFPINYPSDISSAPNGPSTVLILDDTKGLLYTKNFSADVTQIIWQFFNAGIPASEIQYIRDVLITPSGSVWVLVLPLGEFSVTSGGGIYYASAIGGLFTKIIGWDWLVENYPSSILNAPNGSRYIMGMGYNPNSPEEIAIIAGGNNFTSFVGDVNLWIGNRSGFTRRADCDTVNVYYSPITFGANGWVYLGEEFTFIAFWDSHLWNFSADGSSIVYQADIDSGSGSALIQYHRRIGTSDKFYYWNVLGDKMYYGINNGSTISLVGDGKQTGANIASYAIDPTGQYIMGPWDTGARGLSTDYGATWSGLPTLPFGGAYCFAYAGGAGTKSRWIAGRGVLRYSPNMGVEWWNKEGNLGYLIPSGMSITKILVPGFLN